MAGRKKTKYMSKGGVVKRMAGGMAKKTKYKSKGGAVKRRRDRSIEICKQCRCYRCTVKTDWG